MNHTDYTQQNHHSRRMYSKSGRICALLSRDGQHWIFPLYKHPGEKASEPQKYSAHMARCVPVKAVEVAERLLETIDRFVFGGNGRA